MLRDDLRAHIASLQSQIVSALQTDFHTFSTLNNTIADADALSKTAQAPLTDLSVLLGGVLDDLNGQIDILHDTLIRRRRIQETRGRLNLLLQLNSLLQKCERLLREYSATDTTSEHALTLVERISGEAAQLYFALSKAAKPPFVSNLSVRISTVRRSVRNCLDAWLQKCLFPGGNSYNTDVLPRVLSMYVVAGLATDAEAYFKRHVVAPFTSSKLRMTSMLSEAERKKEKGVAVTAADALEVAEEHIIDFLGDKVMPLVSLCDSEERLRSKLDFVGNAVWPQIERSISTHMAAVFSPGIPDVFHRSVRAGARIYAAVEAAVSDVSFRNALQKSKATQQFWRHWNLPVYFQLRFQEITTRFDQHIRAGPVDLLTHPLVDDWKGASRLLRTDVYRCTPTASLVSCLRRCWSEDVFLESLTHRFLRLSLQLLARYCTWVRTGLAGEWTNPDAIPRGASRLYHDIGLVQKRLPAELSSILRLRASTLPETLLDKLDSAFTEAVETYTSLLPDLQACIADYLCQTCKENLQPLRGILATYRMSSKQAPRTHSSFIGKILRPLRTFVKDESMLPSETRHAIACVVVEYTTKEYYAMATDLLQRNRSSEATLRRLNLGRGVMGGGGGVIEKIATQLYLDVEKFTDEIGAVGVDQCEVPSLEKLRESVRKESKAGDQGQTDEEDEVETAEKEVETEEKEVEHL